MPLLARPGAVAVPAGPVPASARRLQPIQVTYTDPDGVFWDWAHVGSGAFVTSVAGIGSAPSAPSLITLPTGDMLVQSVSPGARQIVIGLYAWDDDQDALLSRLDALARALSHDRAGLPVAGTLAFQRPDGSSRQIPVMCTSGPDLPDDDGLGFVRSATYGLTFQPLSPYFEDTDAAAPAPLTFRAAPVSGGVPPMPPVLLSPSTVLGETSVTNSGDADAWPVWTITGPGTPTLKNNTTGLQWGFATALGDGELRIVDLRPGMVSAVDGDGTDWWADLVKSSPRDLWQMVPGVNSLDLQLTGSGDGSQIELAYRRRWRRA
jgi:hypothetical protein